MNTLKVSVRLVARLVTAATLVAIALFGRMAVPAFATTVGPGNAAWVAYYNSPGNTSTWAAFCAAGGGTVLKSGAGVPACGPTGQTDIQIPGGIPTPGFQCVELSERYLYVKRGWTALYANGAQVASVYSAAHGVPLIHNGTAGKAPQVGDVMSFSNTSNFSDTGHTGVVTASAINAAGNGSITLMSENVGSPGHRTADQRSFTVTNWKVATVFGFAYSEWVQSGVTSLHTSVAVIPHAGASGYTLDGYGNFHRFGNAPAITFKNGIGWLGLDLARGIAISSNSTTASVTGYVLDAYGGVHPFAAGGATPPAAVTVSAYWPNWDIARGIALSTPTTGYVLDGFGGIHPFGPAGAKQPAAPSGNTYWDGWDIARGIVLSTSTTGYVLDGFGGIHPFAPAGITAPAAPVGNAYWNGQDIARGIALRTPTTGYVLDGWGGVHPFAPGGVTPPAAQSPGWTSGQDVFRGIAVDAATGSVVDVRAYNSDGTGGAVYSFTS